MRQEGTYSDGGYPASEHLEKHADAFDVIGEMLRLYPDTDSFHDSIVGLVRMYGHTRIVESMRVYSTNAAYARVTSGGGSLDFDKGTKYSFAGGLLGLHAGAVLLPQRGKGLVLRSSLEIEDTFSDTDPVAMGHNAAAYQHYSNNLQFALGQLDKSDRRRLTTAAKRFCGREQAYRGLFAEGVMDSLNNVHTVAEYHRAHIWGHS
jgi:hypothetical protein